MIRWQPIVKDQLKLDLVFSTFGQYNYAKGIEVDVQGALTLHNAPLELKFSGLSSGEIDLGLFKDPTAYVQVGAHFQDRDDISAGRLQLGVPHLTLGAQLTLIDLQLAKVPGNPELSGIVGVQGDVTTGEIQPVIGQQFQAKIYGRGT